MGEQLQDSVEYVLRRQDRRKRGGRETGREEASWGGKRKKEIEEKGRRTEIQMTEEREKLRGKVMTKLYEHLGHDDI